MHVILNKAIEMDFKFSCVFFSDDEWIIFKQYYNYFPTTDFFTFDLRQKKKALKKSMF